MGVSGGDSVIFIFRTKMKSVKTRRDDQIFLVGHPRQDLPPAVLPTNLDVLKVMMHRRNAIENKSKTVNNILGCAMKHGSDVASCGENNGCSSTSMSCVMASVKERWDQAGIPTVRDLQIRQD